MTLVPDRDISDTGLRLDQPNQSNYDQELDSTDFLLGPTEVLMGESIGYCKTQTDPTEESRNVSRSRVGYWF